MRWVLGLMAVLTGCGAPAPPPGTGGGALPSGKCGRGLVVVQSDYQSTNVSLVGRDGAVVSSSFVSSGSADPGLSAALSGDVTVPTARVSGDEVVLIDRYPASVITWVDIETAQVRAQLDVRTGFSSNPQDYLAVSETKAYVSRLEDNPAPGQQPYDEGGDLLVVDPTVPAITGRIDLHEALADAPELLPRANRMVRLGGRVVVLLSAYSDDFLTAGDSRLVVIDPATDELVGVKVLSGLEGCAGLTAETALDGAQVAVACSGGFGGDATADLSRSGIAVLALEGGELVERVRVAASDLGSRPLGFSVAFADDERLLTTGMGHFGSGGAASEPDALVAVSLATGSGEELLHSASLPFELGEVRCLGTVGAGGDETGCGSCWVTDGDRGVLHRLRVGASIETDGQVVVDDTIGLPPRYLGWL